MTNSSKWTLLAIGMIFMPGCGAATTNEAVQPAGGPVVVFGVDGLEWDVVLPLVREGRLPNFRRLMEEGCFGELETFIPTLSPVVWTTVATGKLPGEHGIGHFARQSSDGKVTLLDSTDRKTKAIWNIASDYDKRVSVIGWWMTYPVEDVRGVMVAQTNTRDQLDARGRQARLERNAPQGRARPGLSGRSPE